MVLDKKELRKEQKRREILASAEQVFARQGFYVTTMEEIAAECGWSKGTLYLYFKSKEDLFFSIMIEKVDQFGDTLELVLNEAHNLEQCIDSLIHSQFQFFITNKDFFQLAVSEQGKILHSSDTGLRESLIQKQHQHMVMTSQALGKHLPKNSLVSTETLARSILGSINIHTLSWLLMPEIIDVEQIKREMTELFLNGVNPHA